MVPLFIELLHFIIITDLDAKEEENHHKKGNGTKKKQTKTHNKYTSKRRLLFSPIVHIQINFNPLCLAPFKTSEKFISFKKLRLC